MPPRKRPQAPPSARPRRPSEVTKTFFPASNARMMRCGDADTKILTSRLPRMHHLIQSSGNAPLSPKNLPRPRSSLPMARLKPRPTLIVLKRLKSRDQSTSIKIPSMRCWNLSTITNLLPIPLTRQRTSGTSFRRSSK